MRVHFAWFCMHCGKMNHWNWDLEEDMPPWATSEIHMRCDFCNEYTLVKREEHGQKE